VRRPLQLAAASATLMLGASPLAMAHEAPRVVASIQPIHGLVAAVMEGVGEPTLIVRGYGSPHTYQMRPSEAQALQEADVVFRVGEGLETFLTRPLANLPHHARIVELMETPGLTLLEAREGGPWEPHDHARDDHGHDHDHAHADDDHGHDHDHDDHGHDHGHDGHHRHGLYDGHIWLDPENARLMVGMIAAALAEVDPGRAEIYRSNAESARERLAELDAELGQRLEPVRDAGFIVFHDAYQYLEHRYGLNALGSITVGPERMPGARRLSEIRARIGEVGATCVFREPQFESALIETVVEGTGADRGVLDPLGADLEPGPDSYFRMMLANAEALVDCLAQSH
jgi:zinc transport system substrate-binding protein